MESLTQQLRALGGWGLWGNRYLKPQNPKASRELRWALSGAPETKSQGHRVGESTKRARLKKMARIEAVARGLPDQLPLASP